jgi:peptide/nickel transport system ATP-binding protein
MTVVDTQPLLHVDGLSVDIESERGINHAVRSLAIAIERGQTFALVGESGCGKSITALALLRLLPDAGAISGGRIELLSEDLTRLPEAEMRSVRGGKIGIIFQEPSTSLNPVMRVGDQILETIHTHTTLRGAAARAKAVDWLRRVGIPEPERRIDNYPFQLSGGQKQRVMIAIALAAEPELLIADEPTTALDVTIQAQVLDLLAQLQRELGMAILLITHDLAVVRNVAHHVALMYGGEIVESASAADFFARPRHPYARLLFEAIPQYEKRGRPLAGVSSAELFASLRGGPGHGAPALSSAMASAPALPGGPAATARGPRTRPSLAPAQPVDPASQQERPAGERAAQPILVVRNLAVHYPIRQGVLRRRVGAVRAADGVDFDLAPGRTLALLGESGCGKTTIGKALLRLLDHTADIAGSAMLDGQDLLTASRRSMRKLRRRIQIVFQDPFASLDPRMRVGEVLDEGLVALGSGLGRAQRQQHIASMLQRVGLPADAAGRYPHEFSGGQRQRIAIARALAVSPEVLVLDEPTSALDVSVQAQILNLLHELQQEFGMAYLFITHNFGVVEYMADDIAIMDKGRIVEAGTAEQVLHGPQHEVTKRLLAAVPRLALPGH